MGDIMIQKKLGDIIKTIRLKKGLSQKEACKGICDRRTYIRWEKNEIEPSIYNINKLSNRFNYDFQAYYKMFICDLSEHAWLYKERAETYLVQKDWTNHYALLKEIDSFHEFQNGENKQTILYYKAIYFSKYKMDFNQSIKLCLEGLKEEDANYSITCQSLSIFSNVGLSLLNCLACNYNKIEKKQLANNIFRNLIEIIDNKIFKDLHYYQSIDFEKKLYQITTYNLSVNLKREKQYIDSLYYINKGIQFSLKHNYLFDLADLFQIKFKLLYLLDNYIEAKTAFNLCINLYLLQNNMKEYNYFTSIIDTEYPKLKCIESSSN